MAGGADMRKLLVFRILCVVLLAVSVAALYIEIYRNDIGSMAAVYVWAGLAIAGLAGNAVGALYDYLRVKDKV
jgi:hypothetical protein